MFYLVRVARFGFVLIIDCGFCIFYIGLWERLVGVYVVFCFGRRVTCIGFFVILF